MRYKIFATLLALLAITVDSAAQRVVRKGMKQDGKEMAGKRTVNVVSSHAKYRVDQLNGKWQETKRMSGNSAEPFSDTLLISVNNGKGESRTSGGMLVGMKGGVFIDAPATLIIAGDAYTIKDLNESSLVLADGNFIRTLLKVDNYYAETVGKDSIIEPVYINPVNANIKDLAGKWDVYRRQAAPGFITENTTLIKSISFLGQGEDNTGSGTIILYTGANVSEELTCSYTFANGQLIVTTPTSAMTYTVYKADANEFVFGKAGELLHYAKH